MQIHEIIRDDDPERCFVPGGTIEALLEAKAEGGKWEKFKTTQTFDGTEQHKEWLTSAQL